MPLKSQRSFQAKILSPFVMFPVAETIWYPFVEMKKALLQQKRKKQDLA